MPSHSRQPSPHGAEDSRPLATLAAAVVLLAVVQILVESPAVGVPLAVLSLIAFAIAGRRFGWDRPATGAKVLVALLVLLAVLVVIAGGDPPMAVAVLELILATAVVACMGLLAHRASQGRRPAGRRDPGGAAPP